MKKQKWIRKGMAFVLSLAMVAGLVPAMSGGANKVQAATGSGTEPSVSAYATKTQLMDDTFAPNAEGTAANYGKSGAMPKFSLCSDGAKWFQSKGQFKDGSYVPAAGDIIFFDWGNNGTIDHVGIVESVSGGTVNTIEGNSGDKVARRSYRIGSSNIYGYGVPAY